MRGVRGHGEIDGLYLDVHSVSYSDNIKIKKKHRAAGNVMLTYRKLVL